MDDRLSLYECIRDKISDYFMKQSYTASSDLMCIFSRTLGDKMLWNLLIKGLFHHLHYIPKMQLNLINDQLSSRISELQHKEIEQRELQRELNKMLKLSRKNPLNSKDDATTENKGDTNETEMEESSVSKSTSQTNSKKKDVLSKRTITPPPGSMSVSTFQDECDESNFEIDYLNGISDDVWIKIFQYLNLLSILRCERTCHYFCKVTSNNPACFTNFKYSFCPPNRSYMFRHYQRLNGINDPFYRFRHSTKVHLSFWSKENYEFRLLTAFGDRFRNVRSLTIEVNRESPLVDLSQLVKKYSNFFVSIREVIICVHGLGQPHSSPHNRMMTLYKSLISFILIRCSFIRTLTLNYSLLTQCYRHVSSCLELTQILCINSKSQLFNDRQQIEKDDSSNIIVFKMNNSVNDIVHDQVNAHSSAHTTQNMLQISSDLQMNNVNGGAHGSHHHSRRHSSHRYHHHHQSSHHRRYSVNDAHDNKDDNDNNKMKIIKLGNIENQIQREIKIIFYRRHVRYSFLSYFHNHIRSIHIHNSMGFSNDIESPESRRLNLDHNFGEYEFLEEICLYNDSNKIAVFVNQHCRNCPLLNRMNIIFDSNRNLYSVNQFYTTIKVLLFNDAEQSSLLAKAMGMTGSMENSINDSTNDLDSGLIGLDVDPDNGDDDLEDRKTDSNDSSVNGDIASAVMNISKQLSMMNSGGAHRYKPGLIPKLMRKYLSVITLKCDISFNIKLLSNLEKTMEIVANDMGFLNAGNDFNSLLLSLNLFVHIHIDVECHNMDEIKKLLQLLKRSFFQCDYTSYHMVARKIDTMSPRTDAAVKSPRFKNLSLPGTRSKFVFDNVKKQSKLSSLKSRFDTITGASSGSSASVFGGSNNGARQMNDSNNNDDIKSDDSFTVPTLLISPTVLMRNDTTEEADDGNKSDGEKTGNNNSSINFKDVFGKVRMFKQKLMKSGSDPSANHSSQMQTNHANHTNDDQNMENKNKKMGNHPSHNPQSINSPNQIIRFMKKTKIHSSDMSWICDCKYAQCSRKYRTLDEE